MTRLIVAMSMYFLFDAKSIAEFADYKELNLVYLRSDRSLRINLPAEKATQARNDQKEDATAKTCIDESKSIREIKTRTKLPLEGFLSMRSKLIP